MKLSLALTVMSLAIAIFSMWFFPFNGLILAGLVLATAGIVTAVPLAFITYLLATEGKR